MAEERSPDPVTEGRGLAEALKKWNWGSQDVMYRFKVRTRGAQRSAAPSFCGDAPPRPRRPACHFTRLNWLV